ncbi:hypothetical protein AArcCO_2747 [Halalkaliarchaeum sp. AArc-CO]|nr:hypothetical protein AArcCO_2747 [Halalkaliarchaeum sp. AArc-CO]
MRSRFSRGDHPSFRLFWINVRDRPRQSTSVLYRQERTTQPRRFEDAPSRCHATSDASRLEIVGGRPENDRHGGVCGGATGRALGKKPPRIQQNHRTIRKRSLYWGHN